MDGSIAAVTGRVWGISVTAALVACTPLRSLDERGPLECPVHVAPRIVDAACAERRGPEDDEDACGDGCDNDEDGVIDCGDDECAAVARQTCPDTAENTLARCRNGVDDDDDFRVDCNDPECFQSTDEAIAAYCQTAQENDPAKCRNGIDDNLNGFIDCHDIGCLQADDPSLMAHCASVAEVTPERCADAVDNDDDGMTDCGDPECRTGGHCVDVYEGTMETCMDDVDNDGDAKTDCEDPDCVYAPHFRARNLCTVDRCGERVCGAGPCGYSCGACGAGLRCSEEGLCVAL